MDQSSQPLARYLQVPDSVVQDYLDGLQQEQSEYIKTIPYDINISKQKEYVKEIINSDHDTICGMFLDGNLRSRHSFCLGISGEICNLKKLLPKSFGD